MSSDLSFAFAGLPVEPNSRSEILSATHVFTVEVASFTASPWKVEGGLERRKLEMTGVVLQRFKGEFAKERFAFEVAQERDDPWVQMDYHGLWSHVEVSAGSRFLVVARARSNEPAEMMTEPACKALFDPARAADVIAAIDAEEAWHTAQARGEVAAIRAMLDRSAARRAQVEDVFGRYLGARLEPVLYRHARDLEPAVLTWIAAPESSAGLVRTVVTAVDNVLVRLRRPPELLRPFLATLVDLAERERLGAFREQLIEVFLFNSVFPEDGKGINAHDAIPDPAVANRLAALLVGLDSEEAAELRGWLKAGNR